MTIKKYSKRLKLIRSDGGIMLTYSFENRGKDSLYEFLYKQIKNDINGHKLSTGEKLPSKRALAKHLNISTITVENAYSQLVAEGYIYSIPKSGFYVSDISMANNSVWTILDKESVEKKDTIKVEEKTPDYFMDFVNNSDRKSVV